MTTMQKIRAKNKLADALGIGEHMSVYAIAKKAGIPSATARRYLEQMEKEGRVLRDSPGRALSEHLGPRTSFSLELHWAKTHVPPSGCQLKTGRAPYS